MQVNSWSRKRARRLVAVSPVVWIAILATPGAYSAEEYRDGRPAATLRFGALDQGVDVELPLYGPYQEASYDLNGDRSYFSLLPVWVLSHRTNEGDMSDVVVDLSSNGDWPVLDTKWGFGDAFEPEPQVSP